MDIRARWECGCAVKDLLLSTFKGLTKEEQGAVLSDLVRGFAGQYQPSEGGESDTPALEHVATGIQFRLILGAAFTFGLSENEERAARKIQDPPPLNVDELRPSASTSVRTFLISASPIRVATLKRLERERFAYMESDSYADFAPAFVERGEALSFAQSHGWRLPFELEWEYAVRGGSSSLFVWGDELPDDEELSRWLRFDIPEDRGRRNSFGLSGLFSGDWCLDEWTESHSPTAAAKAGVFVIKGGGSIFWPWQGAGEWVWCMPANRMPSTGLLQNRCAFRVVRELP